MATFNISFIPFFSGLPEDLLVEISQKSQIANFVAGNTILSAGKKSAFLMVVLSGTVLLNEHADDGRVIGVSFAGPNQLLAWLSVIDNKPLSQTIIAASPCTLMICPVEVIQALLTNNVAFTNRFLMLSAESIRRLDQARAMLSLPNAFHRVFVQINSLSAAANSGKTNLPKQKDIANSVNTSRETVSRALQMLIKSGVLLKVGHQIVIKQSEALKKLAIDGPEAMPTEPQSHNSIA